jgi:hypothetical protein
MPQPSSDVFDPLRERANPQTMRRFVHKRRLFHPLFQLLFHPLFQSRTAGATACDGGRAEGNPTELFPSPPAPDMLSATSMTETLRRAGAALASFTLAGATATAGHLELRQPGAGAPAASPDPNVIHHSFAAFGGETRIVGEDGKVQWTYPEGTRDGFVLPNGHLLLTLTKSDKHKGGAVVEVSRDGRTYFSWEGTQSEVNTSQKLPDGRILAVEAGTRPRILELDGNGRIVSETAISCQTGNHHMESRMTRKLPNGCYLVPQLLDKVVREYTPHGQVAWEYRTPETPAESWPFTAIRLENGNTLVNCTHGNMTVEVSPFGQILWKLDNASLPEPLLKDPCGAQRLANGNTVITSYGAGDQKVKLLEVTREKKLVWTYEEPKNGGIHEFQILTTNGRPEPWPVQK